MKPKTDNITSIKPIWLKNLLSGLLTAYFIFSMWTLYAIGDQANAWKIRVFIISLLGTYVLERWLNRGGEGKGIQTNGWMRYLIFLCWYVLLISCLFFYLLSPLENLLISIVGGILIVLGIWLRLWGMRELGKYFSTYLEIWQEHNLIQNGPYRWIRHPVYTGSILMSLGYPLLMSTWWVLPLSLAFLLLLLRRIKLEEAFLKEQIVGYAEYCKKTKKLLPGIL